MPTPKSETESTHESTPEEQDAAGLAFLDGPWPEAEAIKAVSSELSEIEELLQIIAAHVEARKDVGHGE